MTDNNQGVQPKAASVEDRHEVALVEEVPGVPKSERWFIYERAVLGKMGRGTLWNGPSRDAGLSWAAENSERIDTVEHFEP